MKHPAYNLRPNKAVDRFILIEAIQHWKCLLESERIIGDGPISYYGFGGPFLEDIRLLERHFQNMKYYSIERDENTYKRQQFHLSSTRVILKHQEFSDFVTNYDGEQPSVFWLDFTDYENCNILCFEGLLKRCAHGDLIRVTVKAETPIAISKSYNGVPTEEETEKQEAVAVEEFKSKFPKLVPGSTIYRDLKEPRFCELILKMFQIAVERALPAGEGKTFQIINSSYYSDGTRMLSFIGVVWKRTELQKVEDHFKSWRHLNLLWKTPMVIQMPNLSLKERLALEKHLPMKNINPIRLTEELGYYLDGDDPDNSKKQLTQYAEYYDFLPIYTKTIP